MRLLNKRVFFLASSSSRAAWFVCSPTFTLDFYIKKITISFISADCDYHIFHLQGPDPKAATELIKVEGVSDAIVRHLKKGFVLSNCLL